ncbi:MAG: hypothetical protein IJJ64_03710 [Butyrivibrio sp.]|nr:hypothetical protein [Butyrivibrio sp.]
MKKIILILTTIAAVSLMVGFSSITVNASGFDLQAHYEKMKAKREQQEKEFTEKWLDELEADGNLTPEAIKAAGKYGEGRVPNHNSTSGIGSGSYAGGSSGNGYGYSGPGKGWVYSADELHVIGLPEGENGYTLPGWYGDID